MSKVLAVLLVAALTFAGYQTLRAQLASSERDQQAADLTVERAKALGLESTLATEAQRFSDLAREADSMRTGLDTLLSELGGLRARNAALVDMVAEGSGADTTGSLVVVRTDTLDNRLDTLRASFDGPPIWNTFECTFSPDQCSRTWRAHIPGRILTTVLADGELLIAVESDDPQIQFNIEAATWVPPEEPSWLSNLWQSPFTKLGIFSVGIVGLAAWIG